MKNNKIFIINKLSEYEFSLLKKDLIDHSVQVALKIKNLNCTKEYVQSIATDSIERVLATYQFGKGSSLGNLVKRQVMADLRVEFEKTYPDMANKILWPDLEEKKPFDRLTEALQKMRLQPKAIVDSIFNETSQELKGRQQKLLSTMYDTPFIPYTEISKQFGTRGVMTYREIKIIYAQLLQVLKRLEIVL
jgi:hypothetical protein